MAETNNAQVNTTTNHRTGETRQVMTYKARQETLTIHYTIKDPDSHIMTEKSDILQNIHSKCSEKDLYDVPLSKPL